MFVRPARIGRTALVLWLVSCVSWADTVSVHDADRHRTIVYGIYTLPATTDVPPARFLVEFFLLESLDDAPTASLAATRRVSLFGARLSGLFVDRPRLVVDGVGEYVGAARIPPPDDITGCIRRDGRGCYWGVEFAFDVPESELAKWDGATAHLYLSNEVQMTVRGATEYLSALDRVRDRLRTMQSPEPAKGSE